MSIFFDPTEARSGTRMPDCILKAGKPLINLEHFTGADLLLSSNTVEIEVLDDSRLNVSKFNRLLDNGILVQRKSGRDVINFITDHAQIATKMLPWCRTVAPWLLLVGVFNCDREGHLVVDGQIQHWEYSAYLTALDEWQYQSVQGSIFAGCGVSILPRDGLVAGWAARWLDRLQVVDATKEITPFKKSQTITIKADDKSYPWRSTLMTFPGIGFAAATDIARYCGRLADAITFLSNPEHVTLKGCEGYPKNIGPSKFAAAHDWLGLEIDNEHVEEMSATIVDRTMNIKQKSKAVVAEEPPWEK